MRYLALASDYDGTLADHGVVGDQTREAWQRLRQSGRKGILVTGRELPDLKRVYPELTDFDCIVAENGAVLYWPENKQTQPLAPAPPAAFIDDLRRRGVSPLSVGDGIVATWEPNEAQVMASIRELGLELQVIFNKGAVMVLPSGVNKATGLAAALRELRLSPHNVIGVGDAQNDHALLQLCGYGVAVANALPAVKDDADWVTPSDHGRGVEELIEKVLDDTLPLTARESRRILLANGEQSSFPLLSDSTVLIAGSSGGGKSLASLGLLERIAAAGQQFFVFDPEGDYENIPGAVVLGDAEHPPGQAETIKLLESPDRSVVINLLAVPLAERPAFFTKLLPQLQLLRVTAGRPHWTFVDEAHHLLPAERETLPAIWKGMIFVTNHPELLPKAVLSEVDEVLVFGQSPKEAIHHIAQGGGFAVPDFQVGKLSPGQAVGWRPGETPMLVTVPPPSMERQRHRRKYAEGELGPDKSFFFRGPQAKLNLRAENLHSFIQLAHGVDDETWEFHRKHGDYSRWLREAIKDDALAEKMQALENDDKLSARESRDLIHQEIARHYVV